MSHWQFEDYCSESGNNLIQEWYAAQDETVQAEFDTTLNVLAATGNWDGRKDFQRLKKRHAGLCEIRFTIKKVRYRPVGFFALTGNEFVLVLGCKKIIRGNYVPQNAFDLALEFRRMFLEEGKGSICEHY